MFNDHRIAIVEQYKQEEHKLDFNRRNVKNMKRKSDSNKRVGDRLFSDAQKETDETLKEDGFTEASFKYIEFIEKRQKAIYSASLNVDEYENTQNQEVLRTHSNKFLQKETLRKGIAIISQEDATTVDKIHGGDGLSHIALRYDESYLNEMQCKTLKNISEKVHVKYNEFEKREEITLILSSII